MEFVGALINAQRIRDTQKALCEKLDFFLRQKFGAQGRFKPDKEEGKRNVSAEAELRARYMRHAMWLTPDAAAEEARELQEKLDFLSIEFTAAGRDRDQSREFVETIRKLNVLREFGALRYKPVGEIEVAAGRFARSSCKSSGGSRYCSADGGNPATTEPDNSTLALISSHIVAYWMRFVCTQDFSVKFMLALKS
jgi:hypothetical protein